MPKGRRELLYMCLDVRHQHESPTARCSWFPWYNSGHKSHLNAVHQGMTKALLFYKNVRCFNVRSVALNWNHHFVLKRLIFCSHIDHLSNYGSGHVDFYLDKINCEWMNCVKTSRFVFSKIFKNRVNLGKL